MKFWIARPLVLFLYWFSRAAMSVSFYFEEAAYIIDCWSTGR